MQNTLIIFGGRSAEHEISFRSARNIIAALDRKLFKPILVAISRSGNWYLLDGDHIPDNMKSLDDKLPGSDLCSLMRKPNETVIITENGKSIKVDIAFPVLHGPMGEDGTIQGLFEMMLLPYIGPGVLSSAIGMDKDALKQRFAANNILFAPLVVLGTNDPIPTFKDMCTRLKSDVLFVKPAVMGSAVGVSKVTTESEFNDAVNQAFRYCFKILIEKAIIGREIECSVLGNNDPEASCIGEIKPNHEFYNYEAKYLDPNGADILIPAPNYSSEMVEKIQKISIQAFKVAECKGMARVDCFVTDKDEIYVNELNTIPGFTSISMYPKLWEASGLSYTDLITKLLELGKEEFLAKQNLSLTPDELDHTTPSKTVA
jgi:D-alanine-D-alanine ligase